MANIPENIKFLILKWRTEPLSDAERALLDSWYDQELPEELQWYGDDENMLKDRMFATIETSINDNQEVRSKKPIYRKLLRYVSAAAVAVVLYCVYPYLGFQQQGVEAVVAHNTINSQITKVILPDQSIVWLKGNSTLHYPTSFEGRYREVELVGEALFEVSKDKNKPFIIRSGDYTTQVLGTSFNLKVDAHTGELDLSVLTGEVEVAKKAKGMVVAKKYLVGANHSLRTLHVDVDKKEELVPVANVTELIKGTEYDMNFLSEPVETIMKRFEDKFNVTFAGYTGEYKSCNVTADLTDQSLEKSLKILSLSINATYSIKDNTITLTGGGCF